jgi:hypothetical protein
VEVARRDRGAVAGAEAVRAEDGGGKARGADGEVAGGGGAIAQVVAGVIAARQTD